MRKILLFTFFCAFTATGFSQNYVIDSAFYFRGYGNETSTKYFHNDKCQDTFRNNYTYDKSNPDWKWFNVGYDRVIYNNNVFDKIISFYRSKETDTFRASQSREREVITVEAGNKKSERIQENLAKDGTWTPSYMNVNIFDSKGRRFVYAYLTWNSTQKNWKLSFGDSTFYDAMDRPITYVGFNTSSTGGYKATSKQVVVYKGDVIDSSYFYSIDTSVTLKQLQANYIYDSKNRMLSYITFNRVNNKWVNSYKYTRKYNYTDSVFSKYILPDYTSENWDTIAQKWIPSVRREVNFIKDSLTIVTTLESYNNTNNNWTVSKIDIVKLKVCQVKSVVSNLDNVLDYMTFIFPNPANESLNVRIEESNLPNFDMTIFNAQGVLIKKQKGVSGDNNVNTEGFANGVYFIRIEQNSKFTTKKFVVQH